MDSTRTCRRTTLRPCGITIEGRKVPINHVKEGFKNNQINSCVFIKWASSGFSIIVVYVDDINNIRAPKEFEETPKYLIKEFKMKHLRKKSYLRLQIEHLISEIFVHLSNYIEKVLKQFQIDKAHSLSSQMIVWSLNARMIHFDLVNKMRRFLAWSVILKRNWCFDV